MFTPTPLLKVNILAFVLAHVCMVISYCFFCIQGEYVPPKRISIVERMHMTETLFHRSNYFPFTSIKILD